jgi:uncharacterized membrane protein YfcA
MELLIIALVAALSSLLSFFSGFGLGTLLTPAFILFFPPELAIALSGIVHLLNNFFKLTLIKNKINLTIGFKFGIPAIIGAIAGSWLLLKVSDAEALYTYTIGNHLFSISYVKLIIAILLIVFSLFEILPRLKNIQFNKDKVIGGGLLSGFFGGLSGNQGALRSMFLLKCGLSKEGFISTGIFIACLVDITRLPIYFSHISKTEIFSHSEFLIVAVLSAFTGAFVGNKLLKKITLGFVQWAVFVMVILLAVAIGSGLL